MVTWWCTTDDLRETRRRFISLFISLSVPSVWRASKSRHNDQLRLAAAAAAIPFIIPLLFPTLPLVFLSAKNDEKHWTHFFMKEIDYECLPRWLLGSPKRRDCIFLSFFLLPLSCVCVLTLALTWLLFMHHYAHNNNNQMIVGCGGGGPRRRL